jgi:DNA-binding SARP family transcriptional activator
VTTSTLVHTRREIAAVLFNVTAQLLLLTAIPIALWKLSGNPIPKRLPSWDAVQIQWRGIEAQPSQITDFIPRTLADISWIVWAWFAAWTAIGLLWVLLRLPRAVVPGALGAITPAIAFRALSLGALAAHPATPVHSATADSAPATPTPVHPVATGPRTQTTGTGSTVDVVKRGDNLWNLATRYYHQGEDWHEIYDANKGAEQPDGSRLENPDLIQPGWRLAIPAVPAPATPNAANGTGPAARPAPAPHGPATARPTPNRAPGRPAPAPAATGPHTAPAARPGGIGRPASERPHTVGVALPRDAGYIGITLVTSIAAAVTILRARNHHRGRPKFEGVPDLAQHIAHVHSLARSAQDFGFRHEDHPDMDTPPLYQPLDQQITIATSPDGQTEIPYNPQTRPGPLVLTGPGATDAARALAISTLATGHTLDTDPQTSTELLGSDTPIQPRDPTPGTTRIRTVQPGTEDPPDTVIIDTTGHDHTVDPNHTVIEVDPGRTVQHATGPEADTYIGTRIHTLTAQAAATIHETLEDAQPGPRTAPAETPAANTQATTHPATPSEGQPEPDLDLRTLTSAPLTVQLLGEIAVHGTATTGPTRITADRPAALLTLLALHPDGASPRTLHEHEWNDAPDERRARTSLNTTINRVRAPLRKALGDNANEADLLYLDKATGNYRLNPHYVTSDLAIARDLVTQAEAATDPDAQARLLIQAVGLHRGPLAPRIDDRGRDWLTTARYTVLGEAAALHLRIAELTAQQRPDAAARHLNDAVDLTPEDPRTLLEVLQVCCRINRLDLARDLYRRHANALDALGEAPSPDVEKLLTEIIGRRVRT